MNFKVLLGIISTLITFIGFAFYFKDILAHKTKPHAFSWFIWSILIGVAFFGQISDNAGPGAWSLGISAVLCFGVFIFALKQGEKNIVKSDWISFIGALVSIILWLITKTPLFSVILVMIIDALAFYPTFRKSYFKPYSETLITYVLSVTKLVISLFALTNVSIITALYPLYLILANGSFAVMLVIRRKKLSISNFFYFL